MSIIVMTGKNNLLKHEYEKIIGTVNFDNCGGMFLHYSLTILGSCKDIMELRQLRLLFCPLLCTLYGMPSRVHEN